MRLDPLVVQVGVGGKDWRKKIGLGWRSDRRRVRVAFSWRERWLAKVLGDNFGHRPKGARASLAGGDFAVDALDKRWFGIFYGFGASIAWLDGRSSWVLGLKSLPFLEVVVFVIHSFGALWIEPLWGIFFTRLVRRRNKKIHAKKYCVGDERSKRGRIVWKAWRPRVRRVKSAMGVPVSLAVVEDSLRSKGSIQVREEVMP